MNADSLSTALDVSARLAAAGLCLTALEVVADRRSYAEGGVFGADTVLAFRGRALAVGLRPPAVVVTLATLQLAAGGVVVAFGPHTGAGRLSVVAALAAMVGLRHRRTLGSDGAEQMSTVVLAGVALAVVPGPDPTRIAMAVAFIAAQGMLSYTTAGVAKLASPVWRSGAAIPAILDTYSYGNARAAAVLRDRPRLALAATAAVLAVEVPFALAVLGPRPLAAAVLGAAFVFHLSCAVLMGLNSFVWAFPATYPCIWAIPALLA